jgi:hypothetical protein
MRRRGRLKRENELAEVGDVVVLIRISVQVEVYGILELTLKATRFENARLVALSVSCSGCLPKGSRSP